MTKHEEKTIEEFGLRLEMHKETEKVLNKFKYESEFLHKKWLEINIHE
jgi:hypothetical protein